MAVILLGVATIALFMVLSGRSAGEPAAAPVREVIPEKTAAGAQEEQKPAEAWAPQQAQSDGEAEALAEEPPEAAVDEALKLRAEDLAASLSREEKIAQLFFVAPEALTGGETVTAVDSALSEAYRRYPVGGFILFEANLKNPEQTEKLLGDLQRCALNRQEIPVFLGVDEEGGRVTRIAGKEGFGVDRARSAAKLAAGGADAVSQAAGTIGGYLADLGFNLDFAPDADVLTDPENRVIGDRSFGGDPEIVSELARVFAGGLRAHGIIPCYKHYPGHGGTAEDSHEGYAFSHKDLAGLRRAELVPFADAVADGAEMIMAAHISLPEITGSKLPASLSEQMITGILRGELGYEGVVITDALDMGAVSDNYTPAESAVMALQAGCDMLLLSGHFEEAYQAVLDAAERGEIPESSLEESVRRILRLKLSRLEDVSQQALSGDPDQAADPDLFRFVDVFGESYQTRIDPAFPATEYRAEGFDRFEERKIRYEDEQYTSRLGVDVSHHNGEIDWEAVRAAGYEFAFLRLGYRGYGAAGTMNLDKEFDRNVENARKAGLEVGVYFFSQAVNEEEAAEEAAFVIEHLRDHPIDLEVVYDPESILDDEARTDHVSGEQFTKNSLVFCKLIAEAGYRPMIYSNMLWEAFEFTMSDLMDYPFWYADYEPLPQTPYRFRYWQYDNQGTVPGIGGPADLNLEFVRK